MAYLILKLKAVAGITGTALWEAAVLGIPVISFSKNNSFNFLEHVSYVKNQETLKRIISSLEKIKLPNKKFTKKVLNFIMLIINVVLIWEKSKSSLAGKYLKMLKDNLLQS